MIELLCLLLPIAALSGWYLGKKTVHQQSQGQSNSLSSDYYAGLNFLLNEQPDKAVDAFIKMLDASPDTVETTLALGNFFRRRGEVDRAIRIHQNLIAKPNLTAKQKSQALLELAQDYMRAGVLDRAETLLLEIVKNVDNNLDVSLRHLIDIYEREKDWSKAIEVAVRLQSISNQWMGRQIAHYYCELAQIMWDAGKVRMSFKHLKQSLSSDGTCVRASYLQGKYEKKLGEYKHAIKAFKRIEFQDRDYLPEVLPEIIECYQRLNQDKKLGLYLEYLLQQSPSISIVLANAKNIKESKGKAIAAQFLTKYLQKFPSVRGLKTLIEYHLVELKNELKSEWVMLQEYVEKLLDKKPVYQCRHCGFSGKTLLWQCPSCRNWASVKPLSHE
ncbi:MAG: lipopolysaccharide assembly protein LapB [Candidatus Berkiella sp.]